MELFFVTDMTSLHTENCQIVFRVKTRHGSKQAILGGPAISSSRQEKSEGIEQSYQLFSSFPSLLKFKIQEFPRSKVMTSNFILNQNLWKFVQVLLEPTHSNYSHSIANYRFYEEILFCFKFLPSCISRAFVNCFGSAFHQFSWFHDLTPEMFSL